MKMFRATPAALIFLLAAALSASRIYADISPKSLFDPTRHMHVSEVRPGMKGYGLSVFMGTKIERFDVEVISILKNFNPKSDVVLIRFSGSNLEHNLAIAGMSGSPIYLYDDLNKPRMIGAFAYGWQLQKDPIAGVQPIEYMLKLPEGLGVEMSQPMSGNAEIDGSRKLPSKKAHWSLNDVVMRPPISRRNIDLGLQPLATPMMVAGMSPRTFNQIEPLFRSYGLMPLQAGGGGTGGEGSNVKIEPGCVMGVPLVGGDVDMSAVGTCTEVLGNQVFAFGHSFNNEGKVSLPLAGGSIQGIVANLASSFKIGSLFPAHGTLLNDQTVGICGTMGTAPPMVPIDLHVKYTDGSEDQTYHLTTALHPKLTPLLVVTAMTAAISGAKEMPEEHTADYELNLEFANGKKIHVANSAVNINAGDLFAEVGLPMIAAAENPFESVLVKKITGTVTVSPQARSGQILFANVPRSRYRPGETVTAYVTYRPFRSGEVVMPISLDLPRDLPDGTYQLSISDWQKYLTDERTAQPFKFAAETTDEMFTVLQDALAIRHDAIYMRLNRQPDGVAIGHAAMPKLPSSRRQILIGAGRSDITQFVSSAMKIEKTDRVMSGSAEFEIAIDKNTDSRGGAEARLPRRDIEPAMR